MVHAAKMVWALPVVPYCMGRGQWSGLGMRVAEVAKGRLRATSQACARRWWCEKEGGKRIEARAVGNMSQAYAYAYPRPSVTVDVAVLAKEAREKQAKLLLIKRKREPYQGAWALPGGFVDEMEPLEDAAKRELQEETSLGGDRCDLWQVGAFGDPGRDPRGWTITVAYTCVVRDPISSLGTKAADDAADAQWFDINQLPALAFDHQKVILSCFLHILNRPESQEDNMLRLRLSEAIEMLH